MKACYIICFIRSEAKLFIHALKNKGYFLTMILILIFLLPSIALSEESASISGKVSDKETGKGIPGVTLILKRISLNKTNALTNEIETKTNANGNYIFKNIAEGEYYIDAIPNNPFCRDLFDLEVKNGKRLIFNIELIKGGTLSGKIWKNKLGSPFPGVKIAVYNNYCREEGVTDANGVYHVGGLRLTLPVEEDVSYKYSLMIDTQIKEYAFKYIQRVLTINKRVIEFEDILIDLDDPTGINGYFISSLDKKPIELMYVEIEDDQRNYMGNVISDRDGYFKMRGLVPGNYKMYFKPLLNSESFFAKYSTPSDNRLNQNVTVIKGKNPDLIIHLDIPSFVVKNRQGA